MLAGATSILFEGKPIGTPDVSTFWRIIEEQVPATVEDAGVVEVARGESKGVFQVKRGLFA